MSLDWAFQRINLSSKLLYHVSRFRVANGVTGDETTHIQLCMHKAAEVLMASSLTAWHQCTEGGHVAVHYVMGGAKVDASGCGSPSFVSGLLEPKLL